MQKLINPNPVRTIISAIDQLVDFISPSYGPAGKSILLSNGNAVDDGKMAADDFELQNEHEQAIIKYVRGTTSDTDKRVGDGTTTSALIMRATVKESFKDIDNAFIDTDLHGVVLGIKKGAKEAVESIKSLSEPIETEDELYSIAHNSYNDEEVAKLISQTLFKIGKDGVLTIEDSTSSDTHVDIVEGLEIEKGFASPYLVNTPDGTVTLKNPRIFLINGRVELFRQIAHLFQKAGKFVSGDYVIMADGFGDDVIRQMIMANVAGAFRPLLIETPGFGDSKQDNLKDISALTGAPIIDDKGLKLDVATIDNAGTAVGIVAKKNKTIITSGAGDTKEHVETLKNQAKDATIYEKDKLDRRIARLVGGIAVIKVGADTENEQKTKKAKVEDAVNATKSAFTDGVVPGAGKAFDIKTSSEILNEALKAPRKQLEENGAQYLDEGVKDPTGVVIAALESAVSTACGLIEMGGTITFKREEDKD